MNRLLALWARRVVRHKYARSLSSGGHGHTPSLSDGVPQKYYQFRTAHMDEFSVPHGSWKEAYNALQSKYNKQLAVAVLFYLLTIGYVYTSGVIDLVLPPPIDKNHNPMA